MKFFSGQHAAKVVGATADLLLSVDEAQDIDPGKFDKEFDPMTASTNATRVFWGTAWTSQTLLARQARIAREEETRDGVRRVFFLTGEEVARMVPEYGVHLERVVREKGRQHPLVKTQYYNEEIDAAGGDVQRGAAGVDVCACAPWRKHGRCRARSRLASAGPRRRVEYMHF